MAINVYCGVMGSGKSYEVVSGPILHAISSGRRVVTNVDGISGERIQEYLVRKRGIRVDSLGAVVHVTNDRIKQPSFFPDLESPDAEFVVRPGDLVAIDEAWRFWGTDSGKIQDEHMQFFRMHRHMVDPITGLSCDVALMTQDISGLHRALRAVIEMSFRMHKLKSLGIRNGYRVEMYEGWKHNAKTRTGTFVKRYDAEIFPLYQSYAGSSGTEAMIDKRQNVLANVKLLVFLGVLFALSISGVVYAWRFFLGLVRSSHLRPLFRANRLHLLPRQSRPVRPFRLCLANGGPWGGFPRTAYIGSWSPMGSAGCAWNLRQRLLDRVLRWLEMLTGNA